MNRLRVYLVGLVLSAALGTCAIPKICDKYIPLCLNWVLNHRSASENFRRPPLELEDRKISRDDEFPQDRCTSASFILDFDSKGNYFLRDDEKFRAVSGRLIESQNIIRYLFNTDPDGRPVRKKIWIHWQSSNSETPRHTLDETIDGSAIFVSYFDRSRQQQRTIAMYDINKDGRPDVCLFFAKGSENTYTVDRSYINPLSIDLLRRPLVGQPLSKEEFNQITEDYKKILQLGFQDLEF